MPTFRYTARDAAGGEHRGSIAAEDEAVVRKTLRYRGFHATSVVPEAAARRRGVLAVLFGARNETGPLATGRRSRAG